MPNFGAQGLTLHEYPKKMARTEIAANFPAASKKFSKCLFMVLLELVHNAHYHGSADNSAPSLSVGEDVYGAYAEVTNIASMTDARLVQERILHFSTLSDAELDAFEHEVLTSRMGTERSGLGLIQVASYAQKDDRGLRRMSVSIQPIDASDEVTLTVRAYVDKA